MHIHPVMELTVITAKSSLAAIAFLALVLPATQGHAESYPKLIEQGYKTSTMTRGASGSFGWKVSNGEKKYFCRLKASTAYVGSTGMVSLTSSGRQIKLDRKTFDSQIGGPDANIPQLADLKAGKPKDRNVGVCSPIKL